MKNKKLIVCILTLYAGFVAAAQISAYADDGVVAGQIGTIVRSWGSNFGVSYYWVGNQPYLDVASKMPTLIYRVAMPQEINIKDIYIDQLTNMLYFCGTTASPHHTVLIGEGVLGMLKLSDVTNTPPSCQLEWIAIPTVSELTKLVEYDNGGLPQVAAIGVYHWAVAQYSYSRYYLVDCPNASSSVSMATTTQLSMFAPEERYDNIMLTNNLVVCSGYYADPNAKSICYRKTWWWNLYDPMFDDIHYFAGGGDAFSTTHSTALNDDNIITSYLYIDPLNSFYTRLRTIDVAGDVMTYSQEYSQSGKSDPTDIVYIPADNSVVVMHDFYFAGTYNSNFIHIDPFPGAPYITSLEYRPGEWMLSMTMHDLQYYLASKGPSWFLKNKLIPPSGVPDPDCPSSGTIKALLPDNMYHLSVPYPIVPDPCSCQDFTATPSPTTENLTVHCMNL